MVRTLLIANRGEIACRIIQTARTMGIRTVAVYSTADEQSMHREKADEAVWIGESAPSESYLNSEKILAAAIATGADAIHPGYGFLSESASFSLQCVDRGIVFVGPPAQAMRKLGNKIDAKKLALQEGVPITPGYFEPGASAEKLLEEAKSIGFPVMLKAAAGGGGRGMRIVREPELFIEEFKIASQEAETGFADGTMMVEKLIERPRHIEVQFVADQQGNVATLFERECSLQRRHQKLIEEAPSPWIEQANPALWDELRLAVVKLTAAAGYFGAGTAEFMVNPENGEYYFLEVNARLQVEHPVTEAVTGLDLVALQLRIAGGQSLDIHQDLIVGNRERIRGWAVEARIVAEDPSKNFMPSIGPIIGWAQPIDPCVRIDTGFRKGSVVSQYYDSLLAKVIAYGSTRQEAIARLHAALMDFHILGVKTNIGYLIDVIDSEGFKEGDFDTGFLGREFGNWQPGNEIPPEIVDIGDAASLEPARTSPSSPLSGAWQSSDSFRNTRSR